MSNMLIVKPNFMTITKEYPLENRLATLQEAVGGYIEFIDLPNHGLTFVVHEEGMLVENPTINLWATIIMMREFPEFSGYIFGDVVVLDHSTDDLGDPIGLYNITTDALIGDVDYWLGEVQNNQLVRFDKYATTN